MEERIQRLEARARWYSRLFWLLAVAVVAGHLPAARAADDTVTARKFVATDEQGRPRATLSGGTLSLADSQGNVRAELTGNALHLYEASGQPRLDLTLSDSGRAEWMLHDRGSSKDNGQSWTSHVRYLRMDADGDEHCNVPGVKLED